MLSVGAPMSTSGFVRGLGFILKTFLHLRSVKTKTTKENNEKESVLMWSDTWISYHNGI